jgi:hypothetical protein
LRAARLRALAGRYLLAAALLLLVVLGLRSLFLTPAAAESQPRPAEADAPSLDFALQFARAYLSYDASRPGRRARALAPFIPQGMDRDAGFVPARGSRRVLWAQVASDQPALAGGRAITIAARVSGRRLPLYLTVGVRHVPGGPVALLGYPALVGAPAIDEASMPTTGTPVEEQAVIEVVRRVIRHYLSGDAQDLRADLTEDAELTLPTIALRFQSVRQLLWIGHPHSGAVLLTVLALDEDGATYTLTYELGIARRERPYVDFVEVIPTST